MSTQAATIDWRRHWSLKRRALVSGLLIVHLLAVVIAPWAGPPPSALLAQEAAQIAMPYQVAMFLNHGYRFFAPDPGPSHIIRYELTMPDGSRRQGQVPDTQRHWPRLLYHRHFMMTESIFSLFTQIDENAPLHLMTDEQRVQLERRNQRTRELMQLVSRAIARQLLNQYGGETVHLRLQQHNIPHPDDVRDGMKLDDSSLYIDVTDLGEFSGADS